MARITRSVVAAGLLVMAWFPAAGGEQTNAYLWAQGKDRAGDIAGRIAAPQGFERIQVAAGSFADWLRHLPLKPAGTPVYLFTGEKKSNQSVHAAVVDIDTGTRDLQQCADAVIRFRAEYLFSMGFQEDRTQEVHDGMKVVIVRRHEFPPPIVL